MDTNPEVRPPPLPWTYLLRICIGLAGLTFIIDWFRHPDDFWLLFGYVVIFLLACTAFRYALKGIFPKRDGR